MATYESKQTAGWAFAGAGLLAAAGVVIAAVAGAAGEPEALMGVGLLAVALLMANFAVLTVRVNDSEVAWRFGRGPIGWRVPLRRIRGVEVGRTHWYWGWGIRWTRRGWLWRATGLDTVWLELDSDRSVGVGARDPRQLAEAVRKRLGSQE
jgi:hypothetical protein